MFYKWYIILKSEELHGILKTIEKADWMEAEVVEAGGRFGQ